MLQKCSVLKCPVPADRFHYTPIADWQTERLRWGALLRSASNQKAELGAGLGPLALRKAVRV